VIARDDPASGELAGEKRSFSMVRVTVVEPGDQK